ncbi:MULTISPECIES: cation:proton antiporter [Cyanobium]|uniref:cation:proton antiporter n=1 Tax=Cyanobium TaxID=167375 RepID=UPI00137AB065|nr:MULTISPECIES: cation:proton antiporter [Cyanobium]MCP9780540.1 cation:proton antiporter [Cyanobium sp. To12R1]
MGSSLLTTLLLLLVGALLARLTATRLARWAVPAIVLELGVGFALGNTVLPFEQIRSLSGLLELGVLTLFFQVGLEVRGGLLGSRPAAVLRTVLLSALTPLLAWWPLQQGFGLSTATTLLFVAVLSATGTGVTLRALGQLGALKTPSGRLLVGVSVLDDLPAIALLTGSMLLAGAGQGGVAGLAGSGWLVLLGPVLALLSVPLSSWWLRRHGPWQPGPLGMLLLLIGCSWIGEVTGVTSLLGALWGGVLFNRLAPMGEGSTEASELRGNLALLSEVFLPLYFLGVGMRIQAATLLQPSAWWLALVLLLLAIGCKLICGLGISSRDQAAGVDRWVVVFGLIPRGLPGLVFASTALASGVITAAQFSALVLMVSGTTVLGLLLLGRRLSTLQAG